MYPQSDDKTKDIDEEKTGIIEHHITCID